MKDLLTFIKENPKVIDEALTVQQRMKRSQLMKRMAKKIAKKKKIKARRMKTPEELKTKARKAARLIIFKKFSKGQTPSELGRAERAAVERKVDKKKAAIGKIAKKIYPKIKVAEKERIEAIRGKDK